MAKRRTAQSTTLQVTLANELADWVMAQAAFEGMTTSTWLRRLVLRDRQTQTALIHEKKESA